MFCSWPLLPTDKGRDSFLFPFTMSIHHNFNHLDCSCIPKSKPRHGGSCSPSTFHSNQAQNKSWLSCTVAKYISCLLWNCTYCTQMSSTMPFIAALSVPPYLQHPQALHLHFGEYLQTEPELIFRAD